MPIKIIDKLHDSGELATLMQAGIISPNMLLWRKLFHACENRMTQNVTKSRAVRDVSDVFDVSERTVWRSLKMLK